MKITNVMLYELTCPKCGTKIQMSAKEYDEWLFYNEDYGSNIICTDKDSKAEVCYHDFPCPECKESIPVTICSEDACRFGFKVSPSVKVIYGVPIEIAMSSYLAKSNDEETPF